MAARTDVTYFYTSGAPGTDRTTTAQPEATSSSSPVKFSYATQR
jgi:hypothetical protein